MTVGEFREFLLDDAVDEAELRRLHWAITPEIAAAVDQADEQQGPRPGREQGPHGHTLPQHHGRVAGCSACACSRITRPTTSAGILLSAIDGLLFGCGDAVLGVNPAAESVETTIAILGRSTG